MIIIVSLQSKVREIRTSRVRAVDIIIRVLELRRIRSNKYSNNDYTEHLNMSTVVLRILSIIYKLLLTLS